MESKIDPTQVKTPEQLVAEFVVVMEGEELISSLTGVIYANPIRIAGTSDIQERGFIENAIRVTGKNPFTKERMTLSDLENIKDEQGIVDKIKNLIDGFLLSNKQHPEFAKIEELLSKEVYQHTQIGVKRSSQGPTNATPDDLLAMQQAQGYNPGFFAAEGLANPYSDMSASELAQIFAAIPRNVTVLDLVGYRHSASELAQIFASIPASITTLDLSSSVPQQELYQEQTEDVDAELYAPKF